MTAQERVLTPDSGGVYYRSMQSTYVNKRGFTIVELLIVIVVIAILVAISIAAYTSIQNRTHDSVIKSDLNQFAKKIQIDAVERGSFIPGGSGMGSSRAFPGFEFSPTKNSYLQGAGVNNLSYCTGLDSSGESVFQIQARSKSGQSFRYSSKLGMQDLGSVATVSNSACTNLTSTTYSYGYYGALDRWWDWTN